MRILLSPRFWMSIGVMCLSVSVSTGCRSSGMGGGGPGWFSWMNPKPAAGALANTPPTKPSVAMLPPPNTTSGLTAGTGTGTGAAMASYPSSSNAIHSGGAQTPASNSYNTGPYPMGGHGAMPNAATAGHGTIPNAAIAGGGHSSANPSGIMNATTGAAAAAGYSGAQSQFANSLNAATRTADSRGGYPTADANAIRSNQYTAPQGVAPAGNTTMDQWNRGGGYGASASAQEHRPSPSLA